MDSVRELWHRHPYWIAGGIFVLGVIVIFYFFRGRGGSGSADLSGYYGAQAAAINSGNQLAYGQLQAQVASQAITADVSKNAANDQASVTMTQITADAATAQTHIAGDVAKVTAGLQADTTQKENVLKFGSLDLSNTLAAKVASDTVKEQSYQNTVTMLAGSGASIWNTLLNRTADVANTSIAGGQTGGWFLPQSTMQGLQSGALTGFQQIADAIVNLRPNQA